MGRRDAKSSLIKEMLGELVLPGWRGWARRNRRHHQQEPFILNATIENILIGQAYDQARFDRVLDVSALRPDLEVFMEVWRRK